MKSGGGVGDAGFEECEELWEEERSDRVGWHTSGYVAVLFLF